MSCQIAIDGPAGSGKSTIAKKLALKLKFLYVDTGAMYRALGLFFLKNNIQLDDTYKIINNLDKISIELKYKDKQLIFLNGDDVTEQIRTPQATDASSKVAVIKEVREKLIKLQREIANANNVVMDGRDISSFVLPNADLKIYLDASSLVRAKRRALQTKETDIELIKKDIEERDFRDINRDVNPLVRVSDAIYIDTSDLTEDEVYDRILECYISKT